MSALQRSSPRVKARAPRLIPFALGLRAGLRLDRDALHQAQLRRLRCLLEHAYQNVEHYRKLFDSVGFRPTHLKRMADLQLVPVTTRATLQTMAREQLVMRGLKPFQLKASQTGGSTGQPLTTYRTRQESWLRRLLTLRTFIHHGLRWNDSVVTISRKPTGPGLSWTKALTGAPLWNLWFFEAPEELIRQLRRLKPTVIYGYATNLAIVANLMIERGIDDIRPRLLATSSDLLTPGFRRIIKQAFSADPIDIFSCTELGNIGWQCRLRQNFHVNADWLLVELLRNGEPVSSGQTGEVVVTSLFRYAMPLIRYSPGDFATSAQTPCECDLGLPPLRIVDGRSHHIVPLPNGRLFVGFSEIMSAFPDVFRYQVVQTALDSFAVKLVAHTGRAEELKSSVARAFKLRLGTDVHVEVQIVDEAELDSSGTSRTVVPIAPVSFDHDL